jgi:hypothetical protein
VNHIHQAINQVLAQRGTSATPYNPQSNGQAENAVRSIKDMFQPTPTAIKPTGISTCPSLSMPSQDTRPSSSFMGKKQEDQRTNGWKTMLINFMTEHSRNTFWSYTPSHTTSAPVPARWLILQALNSITSYPRSWRFSGPLPLAQAARPIHRAARRDR